MGKVGIIPPPPVKMSDNQGIPKSIVKANKEAAEKEKAERIKARAKA